MSEKEKIQLGKILLKQKLVDPTELEKLLTEQESDHERLASKALNKGLIDEITALKALSEQHGVPATDLDRVEIDLKNLEIIPRDIAAKHLVLPVTVTQDTIHLAMANPQDRRVIDEIEFVSGKKVFPHVALHTQIVVAIEQCYKTHAAGGALYKGKKAGIAVSLTPISPRQAVKTVEETTGTVIADSVAPPPDDFGDEISIDVDLPDGDDFILAAAPEPITEPAKPHPAPEEDRSPQQAAKAAPAAPTRLGGTLKILVVDDEADIRLLISRVLSDKGHNVVTAARGLEAIQKVQSENPDMIILDAMLPEIHGFDICKKIKGSTKYGHIPVIMISAIYRGWRYAQDLKDSYGVDDFIEKPFKIAELLQKVEKHSPKNLQGADSRSEELSLEAERTLTAGINAYRAGNLDNAIQLLKKGIGIDPLAFKLHYHLALLLGKKGLNYQAIRSLENALELAPDYFPAIKNLAVLYQKAGFKFKAIETWERALGFCPDEETREGIKKHLVSLL